MRKQLGWWWALALTVTPWLTAPAQACLQCTVDMWCMESPKGGALCLGAGDWCAMAGKCSGGRGGSMDGYAMVQLSLLEESAAFAVPLETARVQRGIGPLAVGRHALRAARGARGLRASDADVLFSGVGVLDGTSAVIRSAQGDGFVLRRERDGRGARVTVRELQGDRPGRALAEERLGEQDALVVRVTLDGRPRVLVVQAATLPLAEGREREGRCQRAIEELGVRRMPGEAPPFELRALDE
jgi:hypothetical protein